MLKLLLLRVRLWSARRDLNAARGYEMECRYRAAEIAREVLPAAERKCRRLEIDIMLAESANG